MGMTESKRFQVVAVNGGYAVKDTRDGSIWTKTYKSIGWAARKAMQLCEAHDNRRYF